MFFWEKHSIMSVFFYIIKILKGIEAVFQTVMMRFSRDNAVKTLCRKKAAGMFGDLVFICYLWQPKRRIKQDYMACTIDFVDYIADQCAGAGEIVTKKMFGDYAIYCNGKIFGLICDDQFYVKPTEQGRALLRTVDLQPPYEGAKDYFRITDVDDRDYLAALVRETCKALPAPKPKKRR